MTGAGLVGVRKLEGWEPDQAIVRRQGGLVQSQIILEQSTEERSPKNIAMIRNSRHCT